MHVSVCEEPVLLCAALCMAAWRAGWIPVLLKESGVIDSCGR